MESIGIVGVIIALLLPHTWIGSQASTIHWISQLVHLGQYYSTQIGSSSPQFQKGSNLSHCTWSCQVSIWALLCASRCSTDLCPKTASHKWLVPRNVHHTCIGEPVLSIRTVVNGNVKTWTVSQHVPREFILLYYTWCHLRTRKCEAQSYRKEAILHFHGGIVKRSGFPASEF